MKRTIIFFASITFLMIICVTFQAYQTYPYEEIQQSIKLIESPADVEANIETMPRFEYCGETQLEINHVEDSRQLYNMILAPSKFSSDSSFWRRGAIKTMISPIIMAGRQGVYWVNEEWVDLGHYKVFKYKRLIHSVINQYDNLVYIIKWEEPVRGADEHNYVWIFTTQSANLNPILLTPAYMQRYINCFLLSKEEL